MSIERRLTRLEHRREPEATDKPAFEYEEFAREFAVLVRDLPPNVAEDWAAEYVRILRAVT